MLVGICWLVLQSAGGSGEPDQGSQ